VFAHNGDLQGFAPRLHAAFKPVGDTDSELVFCWLMQELAKAHASVPSIDELSTTLRELLCVPAAQGTFNMLLSNGQALWAHASTRPDSPGLHWLERRHPFGAASLADEDIAVDFASATTPSDCVAVIATEPMTRNEPWQRLAPGELAVFVVGQRWA
jgi:predicted glutamine amidotransferase